MSESITKDDDTSHREFREVRESDDLVREYQTPPGDRLYAYRSDDGDHHIIVSQGDEPGNKWVKQTPATVDRPVPGQNRWSIPDNWEKRVHSKRDKIAYALYYVPESDVWARVSVPTNDWLVDAWYRVTAVGDLTVDPVGELGRRYEVRQLATEWEDDGHTKDAAVL